MSFITTVRPSSARLSPSGWFFTSGNPTSVNDGNDASYCVDFTGGASTIAWYCQIYSLAGNQRCAKATLNSRLVSDSPNLGFNMDGWIRPEGVMGDGAFVTVTSANSPTTFQSSYNAEFSQAALNNLETWYRDNFSGATVADICDVWVDLEIHTQPVVTSVGPTGTGITLTPTITWANNFQGDTQNANWIRIYRVSDNALIWDSGRVGVRTSQTTGTLAANTQYRAEVFAATEFYGDWWSNAATAFFTTNVPPTNTVTAPTGTVLNPTPTVTWTYSDTEGNAQSAYQVKIFNAVQYGIGGFDPESSPNTWDSGVTGGAATSRVVGTSLIADSYRAYVKVSDAVAGFGAWSFSSFSVVLVSMPGTGDLSATGVTQTEATALLTGLGTLVADGATNNPVVVKPSRCNCNKLKCDCFILDDGYDGLQITNNNTTTVRGIGLSNRPYYVQNIHHPRFSPPAAKVRTLNASLAGTMQFIKFGIVDLNTDAIFNINQPDRFTINHPGVYLFGASIQWNGPPDLYTNFGIYWSSVGGFTGADPAAASPSILHNVQYRANKANPGETISRMSVSTFDSAFRIGDILRVGVFGGNPSPNPGATQCSFWICYS